jgi:hypothetical protein
MRLTILWTALALVASAAFAFNGDKYEEHFTTLAQQALQTIQKVKDDRSRVPETARIQLTAAFSELDVRLLNLPRESNTFVRLLDHRNALLLGSAETCRQVARVLEPLLPQATAANYLERYEWSEETTALFSKLRNLEAAFFKKSADDLNPCNPGWEETYDYTVPTKTRMKEARDAWRNSTASLAEAVRQLKPVRPNSYSVLKKRYNRLVFEIRKATIRLEVDRAPWLAEPLVDNLDEIND